MKLIPWFAANPVAANLLMLLIWLGGGFGLTTLEREVYPRFSPHQFEVEASYPGAGPEEVEAAVCVPLEEGIHDVSGIKRLVTTVFEGSCQIRVEVLPDHNREALMSAVQARVQSIPGLPRSLERIEVRESTRDDDNGVIWVALYGPVDPLALKRYGERIRADLAALPGVSKTVDYGRMAYEIAVLAQPDKLLQYGLSPRELAEAVRQSSLDLAGGAVRTPAGELLLRVKGRAERAEALGELVLRTRPDGGRVLLKDVAEVRDGLDERWFQWRHDGQPAQGWEIHAGGDAIEVARRVKDYVARQAGQLPEGLHLKTWWDDSEAYEERVRTLVEDGVSGFLLVCLVLTLFLRLRVAVWAGLGILTSVLGALWFMPVLDVSLNMLSLFGFLLAMGILVDDAIIIGESVHAEQATGKLAPLDAAIQGARSVALPVTLSVLIALVAFLPGLFLPGWGGQMMRPICLVMILTLVFSLAEALFILPAHLAATPSGATRPGRVERWRAGLNRRLDRFVASFYTPFLARAIAWRYLALALFIVLPLLSAALVAGGYLRLSLSPDVTKDSFWVRLTVPPGAPPDGIRRAAARVEQALFDYRDELERAEGLSVLVGQETMIWEQEAGLWLELSPAARQRLGVEDFVREWRRRIGDLGQARIDFIYREGDVPYDIQLDLSAPDPAALTAGAEALKQRLAAYPGVSDVMDSAVPGKPEVRLVLKPEAERLGLRLADLAEQVRAAYYGEEAQRLRRGRNEVKVVVRYPPEARRSLDALLTLPVRLPAGGQAPLSALAEVSFAPGYAQLNRRDRRRVLEVVARVDPQHADANALYAELENTVLPELSRRYPGLRAEIGQERREQETMLAGLWHNAGIALAVIYVLIAATFRSYAQPLIFLFAVPVAWSGAVLAHALAGLPLSMESLVGMIAASGVVVNDSLVLLDHIEAVGDKPEAGNPQQEAPSGQRHASSFVQAACAARFRPIFLAFLTNFAGFLPTLLETSAQAQFLVPMTLSLAAGLLFGMAASLVLTPVAYAILQDFQGKP
ncbi:Multidrug efflux pump subunit AcrB [Methylomagnum ishizawai]|uniref:Multidrug efflux pump subunit AcrB n=1 Tax=Methylomagnum ishizawai TaxID=1760988 RepID=A0A1Y6DBH4_9GAMM|nr:efflux RND transporter permease subunit [Methylomagnum ishizawai]SMF97464.1 Multidrug efflux pump subunit AcrB [Methylomagnum ishizawai]